MKFKKNEIGLIAVILLGITLKLFFILKQQDIWWDTSVYYGMGKYIFTFGKDGLWEPLRPLIWPLFLGSVWKIGLPVFAIGKIITVLLSLANVFLVYKMGEKIFDEKIAIFASFLTLFSFATIFLENKLLTEIPAVFLSLLAFHFWVNEKYSLCGFFAAFAFLTKFTQGILIIPFLIFSIKNYKNAMILLASFSATLLPYFVFNFIKYDTALLPLIQGSKVIEYSGNWMNKGLSYFLLELMKENVFFLLALAGIAFALISKDKKRLTLASISVLLVLYFAQLTHKEPRFFVLFIPFLTLISAYGFYELTRRIKNVWIKKIMWLFFIFVFVGLFSFQIAGYFESGENTDKELYERYYNYETDKKLFVTDPRFTVYNHKLELIYYPIFDEKVTELIESNLTNATIAINSCDLTCATEKCSQQSKSWLETLMQYKTLEIIRNNCTYYIFER